MDNQEIVNDYYTKSRMENIFSLGLIIKTRKRNKIKRTDISDIDEHALNFIQI